MAKRRYRDHFEMEIVGDGIDDILIRLYSELLANGTFNKGSRGGTKEFISLSFRLSNPRARISRSENRGKPFSALGELAWYLSKSDKLDFIEKYVPRYREEAEDGVVHGAYGPRIFSMRGAIDQIANIKNLLARRPGSRRAVIQLFNAEDIARDYKEIPCTTSLQFHVRDDKLHLSVSMRSNDAYWGLPHDVFCFTMIQEMMSCSLGIELGEYYHHAGSMHYYVKHTAGLSAYIEEGHQRMAEMPPMPQGDAFAMSGALLAAEAATRRGERVVAAEATSSAYWADIIRLLQVFWALDTAEIDRIKGEFTSMAFRNYVDDRQERLLAKLAAHVSGDHVK